MIIYGLSESRVAKGTEKEVDQRTQEIQEEEGLLQVAHETGQEMVEEMQREKLLVKEGQGQKDTSEKELSTKAKANGMQL